MTGDFRVGPWLVKPSLNNISRNGNSARLEPKVMGVLVCLASEAGEPVSKEAILKSVWPDTFVSDDVLTRSISELRRLFEDDARQPRFIETIPKRGYRLLPPVEREPVLALAPDASSQAKEKSPAHTNRHRGFILSATATILVIAVIAAGPTRVWQRLSGRAEVPRIRSIAVLPLKNFSSDSNQDYFAAALSDELITNLAQVHSLRVISRTSAEQYQNTRKSLPQIARELGVDSVVEGSVVRSGNRVRVTAQLIQAVPEKHIWAGTYESGLQDLVTLQRKFAHQIAETVVTQLSPEESQRLTRVTPVESETYDDYLRGEYYLWNQRSSEGPQKAVEYFTNAVSKDPNYAPAYAGLADAYFMLAPFLNDSRPNELFEKSRAAAFKAVELDDSLADGHRILGVIYFVSWDFAAAGKQFERALTLQPGDAKVLYFHSLYLDYEGNHEQGIAEGRRAVEIDPLNTSIRNALGSLYLYSGRYDQAIEEFNRALEIDPDSADIRMGMARAYELKGDYPRAIAQLETEPSDPHAASLLGYILAKQGKLAQASAILGKLGQMSKNPSAEVSPCDFAMIYAGLGDKEQSLDWLQKAYRQHDQFLLQLQWAPEFSLLATEPQFQELQQRLSGKKIRKPGTDWNGRGADFLHPAEHGASL